MEYEKTARLIRTPDDLTQAFFAGASVEFTACSNTGDSLTDEPQAGGWLLQRPEDESTLREMLEQPRLGDLMRAFYPVQP